MLAVRKAYLETESDTSHTLIFTFPSDRGNTGFGTQVHTNFNTV